MQTEELSHRSFQHEMARYSSNVGNKLQMMIKIGKVCGFTSNFDTPKPFTTRKTVRKFRADPRVEAEQRTHAGDETGTSFFHFIFKYLYRLQNFSKDNCFTN